MSSPPSSSAVSPPPENPPPPLPPPSLPPPPPAVRKFPAPCWTQDETLALIHVYQDKWFSLRRRNLRTADWEAVAEEVNRRCPNQSPPKTSAQCRHKMEKLRKRYRTEKQRITNLPVPINHHHHHHHHPQFLGMGNNFFPSSSWVFFDLMDAMEIGSTPASASGSTPLLATASATAAGNVHIPSKQSDFMNHSLQNGGFVKEEKPPRGKEDLGKYFDEVLMSVGKGGISGGGGAPIKFKVKNSNNNDRFFDDSKYDYDYDGSGRNFASGSGSGFNNNNNGGNKRKIGGGGGGGFVNGHSSKRGPAAAAAAARGRRGEGAVGEMVASINMLGDGLLKMEKMKMEMMQDLQRQRMEMEINNSKMILESQHSIVNAFLQGFNKLNKPNKLMHLD